MGPARVHIISDSTGETGYAVARAAIARFHGVRPTLESTVLVRTDADVETAIQRLNADPACVFHTLADTRHRAMVEDACRALGVPAVGLLDAPLAALAASFGQAPRDEPGMQHRLDETYFRRIAALDFAISYDDGATGDRLRTADVILAGVSRTSKTPTCIYLAYRGIRAANLPLVPGRPVPAAFQEARAVGVLAIGLTASANRLAQVRSIRLEAIGDRAPGYAEPDRIRHEITEARLFFERHDLAVIDVTRRSIEETAAAVQSLLADHRARRATASS